MKSITALSALVGLLFNVEVLARSPHGDHHDRARTVTVTSISTVTNTPTARCNCPLEKVVTTTVSETCNCPAETVVTKYASCNATSAFGTGTGTGTGTASAKPTCSLTSLPARFYLKSSMSGYLYVDLKSNEAIGVPTSINATVFYVKSTTDGSITGIQQLAFTTGGEPSDATEYGTWVPSSGGKVQFFNSSSPPGGSSGYGIVTADFSTYLCQMELITWLDHDVSYPEDCSGGLWLSGGDSSGCKSVSLTVLSAIY